MITLRNIRTLALVTLAGSAVVMAAAAAGTSSRLWLHLTRATPGEARPSATGFIQRWVILDPISATGDTQNAVQATVKTEHFPNEMTVVPHDGDKATVNGADLIWHAVDTNDYNVNLYYFAAAFGKSCNNAMFWAVAVINCPQEMTNVRLAIGSNSASVWWVNGKEVIGIYGDRQAIVDDGVSKRLTLKKGVNIVRGAIINRSGAADFCARFLDKDDKPLTGYTITVGEAK
jgi:hypothetical protein